jgi:hypothetical protein
MDSSISLDGFPLKNQKKKTSHLQAGALKRRQAIHSTALAGQELGTSSVSLY